MKPLLSSPREIINILVLVYDNADHTDDDTDSLDVSADTGHVRPGMPHVEMVAPAQSEEEAKEEPPKSEYWGLVEQRK